MASRRPAPVRRRRGPVRSASRGLRRRAWGRSGRPRGRRTHPCRCRPHPNAGSRGGARAPPTGYTRVTIPSTESTRVLVGMSVIPMAWRCAMRRSVAAAGSAVFFLVAPTMVAVVVPWLLTGWQVGGLVAGSGVSRGRRSCLHRHRWRCVDPFVRKVRYRRTRHSGTGCTDRGARRHRAPPLGAQSDVPGTPRPAAAILKTASSPSRTSRSA
jgi:hypothetical protein